MKFGDQYPEGTRPPAIERELARAGIFPGRFNRPRIQLPDFPHPPLSEAPPKDEAPLPEENETDNDPTDPKLIRDSSAGQVKIPR